MCTNFVIRIESRPHNEHLATNDQNITINTADEHEDQHNVDSNADGVEPETNYLTHLPMDLILEIFSRLDVINILRYDDLINIILLVDILKSFL